MPKEFPHFINPEYEKNQARKVFQEKYHQREKMSFEYGELEYIDLAPEKKTGQDIFIAVGTPSSWEQMEDFVFQLVSSGRRVTALAHPQPNFKQSMPYDPKIQRPKALETFFQKKHLEDMTVIAHSFGLLDVVRKGPDGIGRLIALNPAGLSENNPLKHFLNSTKSAGKVFSKENKEDNVARKKLIGNLLRQSPIKSAKELLAASQTDLRKDLEKFSAVPLIVFRNTDDTLLPPKKAHDQNYQKLTTGGDHLGPFVHSDQAREIILAIEQLEEKGSRPKAIS